MKRSAPIVSPDDSFFWEGVAAGELRLQRCAGCNRLRMPPSPMCPSCHSLQWRVDRASGRGTVYSWVIPRHSPSNPDQEPPIVVLVELEEGVRLVSNLCEVQPEAVHNGMAVEVCFPDFENGVRLHQFRPVR
jgi:uncharacterized OB-fold protein